MWLEDIVGNDLAKVMLHCKGFDVRKDCKLQSYNTTYWIDVVICLRKHDNIKIDVCDRRSMFGP